MTQTALLEFAGGAAGEYSIAEGSPSPSVAALLFGARRRNGRSEARDGLNASLWLTSLQKPGVFEVAQTENVSRFGVRMISQGIWEPDEMVLVSSPPGFCAEGSVVYCKQLPSDDYIVGIRLDAPVEQWTEALAP
jgi:hypothetical protein